MELIVFCAASYILGVFTATVAKPIIVNWWAAFKGWLNSRKPQ